MWSLRTIVLSRSLTTTSDRKLIFLIYYEIFYRARFLLANISHLSDDLIVLLFYSMQYLSGSNKMYLNEPGTKSMISNIKNIQFYFVLTWPRVYLLNPNSAFQCSPNLFNLTWETYNEFLGNRKASADNLIVLYSSFQ